MRLWGRGRLFLCLCCAGRRFFRWRVGMGAVLAGGSMVEIGLRVRTPQARMSVVLGSGVRGSLRGRGEG